MMNLGSRPSSAFDDFWEDPSSTHFGSPVPSARKTQPDSDALLSLAQESGSSPFRSVNESPDFHDPFSELSLFLARQVRKKLAMEKSGRSWSAHMQEELLRRILPEFEKRFPKYLLSTSALKRVWEKGSFYLQQLEAQASAIRSDGSVDLEVMIRENFRSYESWSAPYNRQPHYYAQHLALKLSECIATLDGIRLDLHQLTTLIWGLQRHLSYSSEIDQLTTPFDEIDGEDQQIVQALLELTAGKWLLAYSELKQQLQNLLPHLPLHKIERWALQGEMLCRFIRLSPSHPRLIAARDTLEQIFSTPGAYLTTLPPALATAARLVWYGELFPPTIPTWERWLLWQAAMQPISDLADFLNECASCLPLVPFHEKRIRELLLSEREEQPDLLLRHIRTLWQRSHTSAEASVSPGAATLQ